MGFPKTKKWGEIDSTNRNLHWYAAWEGWYMQLYSNRSIQVSIIYICDGADANMLICYGLWPWGHTLGWVAFEKKSRMVEFENLALSIHFVLSLKLGAGCLSYPCLTLSLPTWSSICMPIWLHFSQVVPFFLPYSPCCHFMWVFGANCPSTSPNDLKPHALWRGTFLRFCQSISSLSCIYYL